MEYKLISYGYKLLIMILNFMEVSLLRVGICIAIIAFIWFNAVNKLGAVEIYLTLRNLIRRIRNTATDKNKAKQIVKEAKIQFVETYIKKYEEEENTYIENTNEISNIIDESFAQEDANNERQDEIKSTENIVNELNQRFLQTVANRQQQTSSQRNQEILIALIRLNLSSIARTYNKVSDSNSPVQVDIIKRLLIEKRMNLLHRLKIKLILDHIRRYGPISDPKEYYILYKSKYIYGKAKSVLQSRQNNQ